MPRIVAEAVLETARFEQGAQRMRKVGADVGRELKSTLGRALAASAVLAGLDRMADKLDRVDKLAKRLNVSPESLQRLGMVAELNAVSLDEMANALVRMNRKLADTSSQRTSEAALEALNIEAAAFRKLAPEQQLAALADGYVQTSDKAAALAAMFKLMEDDAKKLIPVFQEGGKAVREMLADAPVVSAENVAVMVEYKDAVTKLSHELQAMLAPSLGFVARMLETISEGAYRAGEAFHEFWRAIGRGEGRVGSAVAALKPFAEWWEENGDEGARRGERRALSGGEFTGSLPRIMDASAVERNRRSAEFAAALQEASEEVRELELAERLKRPGAIGAMLPPAMFGGLMAGVVAALAPGGRSRALGREADGLREMLAQGPGDVMLGANRSIGSRESNAFQKEALNDRQEMVRALKAIEQKLDEQLELQRKMQEGEFADFEF